MSSAAPEPGPHSGSPFSVHLRVVKPGEPTVSAGEAVAPNPIDAGSGAGFEIAWNVFRVAVWATILVWMFPEVLVYVGRPDIGRWLNHHGWVRLLGVPPLGLLAIITAFERTDDPRKRAASEARDR